MNGNFQILIVAGEASGDLHGANLVCQLKQMAPMVSFFGIGGPRMQEAGVELIYHIDRMALVGFVEVIRYLPFIRKALSELEGLLENRQPNLAILIDYPGFNLKLAEIAHDKGIPVLYYISPQVWAWGANRVRKIANLVDKMAVVFPFEVDIYKRAGLDVEFVGHPLLEVIRPRLSKEEFCQRLDFDKEKPILGLLPGSRRLEVIRLLPIMLKSTEIIKREKGNLQVVVGAAPGVDVQELRELIARSQVDVRLIKDMNYDVMKHSDLLLVTSGTATLESACLGSPMIILYKVGLLSWLIGRQLVKVSDIGLVNILAGRRIVPEFVQFEAKSSKIASAAIDLLQNGSKRQRIREELLKVREQLGAEGASRHAAEIALEMLTKENPHCPGGFTTELSSS